MMILLGLTLGLSLMLAWRVCVRHAERTRLTVARRRQEYRDRVLYPPVRTYADVYRTRETDLHDRSS